MVAPAVVTGLLSVGGKLIDKLFPDPEQKAQAQIELLALAQSGELQELATRAGIIETEAKSESWITRSWRPITMLTFTALVVAHWMGWTAPNLSEALVLSLLDIVQVGIGGYIVGRSAEKVAPKIAEALKGR